MHVLIIEDEPRLAWEIHDFLEEWGVDSCSFAETQQEAITEAGRCAPHLILSDVRLRQGNGPAAVHTILDQLGDLPVVFITASPDDPGLSEMSLPIVEKPVMWLELVKAIESQGIKRRRFPAD